MVVLGRVNLGTYSTGLASPTHIYRQVSNIRRTLVGNEIVDHSDVVGASPVGATPTAPSFSTQHLSLMDWAKTTVRRDENHLGLCFGAAYFRDFTVVCIACSQYHICFEDIGSIFGTFFFTVWLHFRMIQGSPGVPLFTVDFFQNTP